jgi:hypothetical protein
VAVVGPYRGRLANNGEAIALFRPDAPVAGVVPWILAERVAYRNAAPWPAGAEGAGVSLQRAEALAFGNEPTNWIAAASSPGGAVVGGAPPVILAQPSSIRVVGGQDATLVLEVSGSAPMRYQWQFNGANLPAGTNDMLLITNAQPRQVGDYRAFIFNGAGAIFSESIALFVQAPPRILAQPQGRTVSPGSNVTFTVVAEGLGELRYQWRFNSNDLASATSASLSITNAQLLHNGVYAVLVTDDSGFVFSQPAYLVVRAPPVISAQPRSLTVVEREPANFRVSVKSEVTLPLGFRWRRGTTTLTNFIQNDLTSVLTLAAARLTDAGNYTVVITNGAGQSTISAAAILTVLADLDADGLPDLWEAAYGFPTNNPANALLDPDGDGMTNRAEYLAGTDPTNGLSYLKVDRLGLEAGAATLEFVAVSNRAYTVQFSDTLAAGSWRALGQIEAQATNRTVRVTDPGRAGAARFYRLAIP